MASLSRRRALKLLGGPLLGGLVLSATGCDLGSLAYFVMPEAREPAKIKNLGSDDPKKENKVVIVPWSGLETRAEFIHADRQLAELLAKHLHAKCSANDQKINIVPMRKVDQYKNTHPDWRVDIASVGRHFGADYVIYLEINSLSMYEKGSLNSLYRGQANITVTLIDVKNPDEAPEQQLFNCTYPSAPEPVDGSPVQFRQKFLDHVAKKLTLYFSQYPKREEIYFE